MNEKCESYEKEQEKLTLKFERIKTNINKSHEDNLKLVNEEWQGKMNQKVNEVSILNEKIASKDSEFLKYKSEIDQNYKEINALKTKLSSKDKENQSKIKGDKNIVLCVETLKSRVTVLKCVRKVLNIRSCFLLTE